MRYFERNDNANAPYWPSTSTMDWCEENYVVLGYVAEFWNTITNVFFIGLALYGLYKIKPLRLEARYYLAYLAFAGIGLGSWMFHMTLSYEFQLLDELPMVYLTLIMLYTIFESAPTKRYGNALPLGLSAWGVFVTIVYHQLHNPLFFLSVFTLQTTLAVTLGIFQFTSHPPSAYKAQVIKTVSYGLCFYLIASAFWLVDNEFCHSLRSLRSHASIASPALQFHAWWHMLSSMGCYCFTVCTVLWRMKVLGRDDEVMIDWKAGVLPVIESTKIMRKVE